MANKLAFYLRRIGSKEVNVDQAKVAELLGQDKAEELAVFSIKKSEVRTVRVGPRSAIPPRNRVMEGSFAMYNRQQLLDAIDAVHGPGFQAVDPNQAIPAGAPNPELTPAKHVKKLQERGLLP